ncbi:MAG: phosphoribosylformylglycinamidine synthase subunit PurL [Planctomycetes bacterium]|nr:phosphoribosylformylglycinamidine synthase subunit PurL [Planctomycetota bacterium]
MSNQPLLTFVQVTTRPEFADPAAHDATSALAGFLRDRRIESLRFVRGFVLEGVAAHPDGARAARDVLADPVAETWSVDGVPGGVASGDEVLSVVRRAGVMDPTESSCRTALTAAGIAVTSLRSVRRYVIRGAGGPIGEAALREAARKTLANEVIEEIHFGEILDLRSPRPAPYEFRLVTVPLRAAADEELIRISKAGTLSLSLAEMRAVQAFFTKEGRDPTDAELETVAQTWSEHCKHKTLAGEVRFRGDAPNGRTPERTYRNLLKETVFAATQTIARTDCLSVFRDNAGIIAFDDDHGVCMKVETHNHPSAIEPYGGAGTGIGGVIRDILGTGLGAKPFLNTDVFCFAPPDTPEADVPKGCLHPRRVMKGVISGVRDYGNRMGIPTASGGLFFDPRYIGNPIVYCGTVGLIPRGRIDKAARPGDRIIAVGGRTGRDGIHGATFSSAELHAESETVSAGAVQIGNAIEEKRILDGLLRARDEGLLTAVTDCGAGGFSSAVGEMGAETGAEVELSHAPLKYPGLSYAEIWISEAQERMVLAVAPSNVERVRAVFGKEGVEVTDLGEFTGTGRLVLRYGGTKVGDVPMEFLHDGLPRTTREAAWTAPPAVPFAWPAARTADDGGFGDDLLAILSSWNVCSKEWVIRRYDHEVQGGSAIKPLVGVRADGPGDACVNTPLVGNPRGVAVSSGMNPRLGDLSPYDMATNAVDEALRNLTAVGADPRRAALLDNYSWGNATRPDRLGSIVLASEGLHDAAVAFGTPFVSGKDSLNNEFQSERGLITIPCTMLVSAMCVVDDVRRCVTMDLKAAGNLIVLVGITRPEMGGSHYAFIRGIPGGTVPVVRLDEARAVMDGVHRAISEGLVRACHDLSEGGVAVALAEMAFAGGLAADVSLVHAPYEDGPDAIGVRDDALLFSESPSRFLCEVRESDLPALRAALRGVPHAPIGRVMSAGRVKTAARVTIRGVRDADLVNESVERLRDAFTRPLRNGGAA